jgi:hypothetical protein
MKFDVRLTWTQWYLGVWWWPIKKDRAFGVNIGPLAFVWRKR